MFAGTIGTSFFFEEKSGQKPERSIVETDDSVDMPGRSAVIPGAAASFFQIHSGSIFHRKDTEHVNESASHHAAFFQQS